MTHHLEKRTKKAAEKYNASELLKKLAACEIERDEYLRGWQRAKADFINARKEEDKSREEFRKFSKEDVLYELLELMDVFDQALKMQQDEGIMQLHKKFMSLLEKHGVHMIEIRKGAVFNPKLHEAIGGEGMAIKEVAQNGYTLHDKVLRPARVVVSDG